MVLQYINRILQQAIRAESEEKLGEACLSLALAATGSEFGFIDKIGPDGKLYIVAISNTGWDQCTMHDKTGHRRTRAGLTVHGLYGRVMDQGHSFFTNEPSSHPDRIGLPSGHPPLTSFLGVPLKHEGHVIGLIGVANRMGGYRQEEADDLEALVPSVVEALMRKRADEALRESEERFKAIAETTPVGISVVSLPESEFLYLNPAYEKAFGYVENEILGHGTPEIYWSLGDRERIAGILREQGQVTEFETQFRRKNGTSFWGLSSIRPITYQGRPALLGVFVDITDRKRAEEEILRNAEELRASNEELERFNRAMVNRELRMIEMKKEINELCQKLNKPKRYETEFDEEQ